VVALAAPDRVTRHVMEGRGQDKAEAAAVTEAATTTGRAATTATEPPRNVHGARLALAALDRVTHGEGAKTLRERIPMDRFF
jgi:hypothetical protein